MYFFIAIAVLIALYIVLYILFQKRVKAEEHILLELFLRKMSKVPALIEVMRPYIAKEESFHSIIELHTESMIESADSLYDVLSNNARLHGEFLFLMKLSVHTRGLQKNEYFVYIRDFIIEYEHIMQKRFTRMNQAIRLWNRFIRVKNATGILFLFPGSIRAEVS